MSITDSILPPILALAPWEMINSFLIPFVLIFVILWAILTAMKLFNKKVNLVISFAVVLLLSSTNFFPMIAGWIQQLVGMTAAFAFLLVMIGGVVIWAVSRTRDIYYDSNPGKAIDRKTRRIGELERKIASSNEHEAAGYRREIKELEGEIENIRVRSR